MDFVSDFMELGRFRNGVICARHPSELCLLTELRSLAHPQVYLGEKELRFLLKILMGSHESTLLLFQGGDRPPHKADRGGSLQA